jgi:hypothetical protein
MLSPLMEWWGEKGKEFARKNGHMMPNEADVCDRKLKTAYKWLDHTLNKGQIPQDAEEEEEVSNLTNALSWG